ncbi:DNA cytosine methyltransferase [Pseudomonas monteilii]|uniref:DNA cytosine methyltransferase n=1 Tax=Pseudomonas monteilii TaxID=76759 RepID=UPI003D028B04
MTAAIDFHNNASCAPTFIDVFAGCGGLSLGLMQAGWNGIFAIEQDHNAFQTLKKNLTGQDSKYRYSWPNWIPQTPHNIYNILDEGRPLLERLAGNIDMLVGGPPCQGFSSAGKRNSNDPRNKLVEAYVDLVKIISPKLVLIENVRGITSSFKDSETAEKINYSDIIISELSKNYIVDSKVLDLTTFGVPQNRFRFFIIAIRKDITCTEPPFEKIESLRESFLSKKMLSVPVSAKSAISDFETEHSGTRDSRDSKGFKEIGYKGPRTRYQKLMNAGETLPSNTRLANHKADIKARFKELIAICNEDGRLNVSLSQALREKFNLKKKALRVMDPLSPSPTITSMPDDLIHYLEARTLTVRENARLQSFPDWYDFQGKYTSGGDRRKREIPRFTQVANAVPPLAAEAIGMGLKELVESAFIYAPCLDQAKPQNTHETLTALP